MEDYNERAWYTLTGPNGEQITSFGDNDYVRHAVTSGIPISVTSKGEWFTVPYVEVTPTGYLTHLPTWFKGTNEYKQWQDIQSQASTLSVNKDNFNNINNTLKALGNQGLLRYTTKNQSVDAGIVSPSHQNFVFDQYIAAINEGAKNGAANLVAYGDTTGKGESVADMARYYKNLSKEDLSKKLLEWKRILDKDNTTDSQDEKANVLATYKILNLVADNPSDFGDGEEFKGLLEASEWQKFQTHINNVIQSISEGMPIVTFGARLGSGLASGLRGEGFGTGWQIENRRDQRYGYLKSEATGGGLRGTEGSAVSGTVAGSVVNMAGTMAQSAAFGTWLNSASLGSSVGTALTGGSSALSKLGGGMIYDFFANDLPVDLSLFAADLASTGSAQEAWESQTGQTQPLFGLFGPQVPAGLKYNLIGDAMLDLTLPVISIGNKAMYNKLDDITGGTVSKIRENIAVKNLAVQQKISDMPVIGTGLQKFSNWLFSAENASYIREKRKEAIIAGSMTPYIDAQNLLTLKNHYGAEVVAPLYAKKANDLNINSRIKDFQKNANRYGGMGEVKVEWDTAKGGVAKKITETVQDDLPRDVKQGLLDYQRLEELKGEKINEAEVIANPRRDKQIATLEKKVADMPEEIRKFAEDFSTLNKQVEQIAVDLGLKPQDWLDALLQDPRWKNYMVRQVLLPGGIQKAGSYDPATNKLLTGKRTGYYDPSKTLSPVMALDMKVHALGNAYAWNERAKSLVAAEMVQGKITSGGNSVELAQKISTKKAELMAADAANAKLGYDAITKGYNDRMSNLSESVRKINEKLQSVDNITAKSVYTTNNDLETKGIVADFNSGKITYGDGVLEGSGLSVQDGNAVINNTYRVGTNIQTTPKQTPPSVPITPRKIPVIDGNYTPAVSPEDFRTKYGIDARRGLSLGSIDNEGDALTLLKDKIDANGGTTSQRDIDVVLNKFPEAKSEYKKIQEELEPGYTRDDVITELYNRRVAEPQGLERRLTKEEWDWVEYQRKWGGDETAPILQDGASVINNTYIPKSRETFDLADEVKSSGYVQMYRGQGTGTDDFYLNEPNQKTPSIGDGYFLSTDKGVSTAFLGKSQGGGMIEPLIPKDKIASRDEVEKVFRRAKEIVADQKQYNALQKTDPKLADLYDHAAAGQYDAVAEILEKPVIPYLDAAGDDERLYYKGIDKELDKELKNQLSGDYSYQKSLYDTFEIADGKTPKDLFEGDERWESLSFTERMELLDELDDKMVDDIDRAYLMLDVASARDLADEMSAIPTGQTYAGITSNGVPYEYTIENNKITSMTKITSDEGLAESVSSFNQGNSISIEDVRRIGGDNVAAINKAQMMLRDNNLLVPGKFTNITSYQGTPSSTTLGFCTGVGKYKVEGGQIVGTNSVYLNLTYFDNKNANTYKASLDRGIAKWKEEGGIGYHPKNSNYPASVPAHELFHNLTQQLAVAELNDEIKQLRLPIEQVERMANETSDLEFRGISGAFPARRATELEATIYRRKLNLEERIIQGAFDRIGKPYTDRNLNIELEKYSNYARTNTKGRASKRAEAIAEGGLDYLTNGNNASEFVQALAAEISERSMKFAMVVNPRETLQANNLNAPKGLFKGDDYAFPASVNTQTQKAEWLDKWRQKNPYLKGELTEETFQKANLWDSYFQKEIRSYDGNSKSVAPDSLIKKSGDFVEKQRAQMAKDLTDEIRRMSGGEFDSDLAMVIMGRNGDDIAKAMDNYIIRQIDSSAEELAKNMDGGLTEENLNIARITLWSDESTRESTKNMMMALVPDGGDVVTSKVDILFDTQAKGLAAYDALPLDTKQLLAEKDALVEQLYKENGKVIKEGKNLDKNSSFIEGGTHVIHYKESGEDVYVTVDDPVIASILQKPYDYKEHGLIAESLQTAASFLATTYRLGTTGINPMAFIRNVLRDPIQAMVTGGFNPLNMSLSPEVFYKTLRQYGLDDDTILQVTDRIRNWAESSTMTAEMRLGPGKNSSSYRNEVQKLNNKLRDVTNGKIITALQTPLESWEGFFRNQIGQQSFMKNFKRTGDVDKALSSALFDTSNVTTNFSHAIGKFKNVTATIPYLSSAINGTVSFWRLFNIDPMGMTARITAGFMLPVMAITAWNLSSEENRRAYETLPEWFKQGHIVLTDPSGNIIAFPLPEEIQQFAGTARKLIEYTNDVSPYSLATIAAQGAFGFLPFEVDGFWGDDGSFQLKEGAFQMVSGLIPQAATTLYELIWQQDLFTGQDLSTYNGINTAINTLGNIFGTGIIQAFNSIGIMAGASESDLIGKSFQNTIARDLFGQGFDAAKNQFMNIVGKPAQLQQDGKMSQPTGLFKKNEDLKKKIDALNTKIAVSSDSEKVALEEEKQKLINEFTDEVKNAMDKYQRMFSLTGGLEQWQKNRLVQLLTLGDAWSSGEYTSYQSEAASEAYLNERGLAMQRYVQAGLPAGPDLENLASGSNSIEIQAALNSFYGGPKQAATDYRNAVENTGLKDIRNEFYNVISQIYDSAEAQNKTPDYDMIEKIQARYLQAFDSVLIPIINQYGINILNNADFINAVRKQVNGMIPSDDWRQSVRNAKKFLSSKDFPTTTVDVKKWLIQRYSSGMRNRNIDSDPEVTNKLAEIKADIDAGRRGNAQGKIKSLMDGVDKANFYISSTDLQTLTQYNNMLK